MRYIVKTFHELREKYSSWDSLKNYLLSAEGGFLKIIDGSNIVGHENQAIIRYDKSDSDFTKPHVKWFRSVVWDKLNHIPISISPPKATELWDPSSYDNSIWQHYLDGFMMNMYKTEHSEVQYATRSGFDATGTFYSQRSFIDLFTDAFRCTKTTENSVDELLPMLVPGSEYKSVSASLLIQHPEHRVVEIVTIPKLYIAHVAYTTANGIVEINELPDKYAIPMIQKPSKDTHIAIWVAQMAEMNGWYWQGVTIKDNGNRWRFRTAGYRMVRSLRGNSAWPIIRFVQLFHENLIDTYLFYYPEDTLIFNDFMYKINKIIKTLYNLYVQLHITKSMKNQFIQTLWKPHLFSLHGYYLYTLREKKHFVREKDVEIYIKQMPWQQLLYIMEHFD
jgi:hypothetical protein